jgi:hypothetical protein
MQLPGFARRLGALATTPVLVALVGCAHGETLGEGGAGGTSTTQGTSTHAATSGAGTTTSTSAVTSSASSTSAQSSAASTSAATSGATTSAATTTAASSSSTGGGGACHDPCLTGAPLTPLACIGDFAVFACSQDVCSQTGLDYCCTTTWDQACIDGVNNSNLCLLQLIFCI